MYKYGEEISYEFNLLKVEDGDGLQLFTCGNERLDHHIRNDVIKNGEVVNEDGLYFKFVDQSTNKIIAVVSLASSGIIYKVGNYTHVLPAIKIDVLAVDEEYQKMHYNAESKSEANHDEHYYFNDDIIGNVISHCREISEEKALADYIVLYTDNFCFLI